MKQFFSNPRDIAERKALAAMQPLNILRGITR